MIASITLDRMDAEMEDDSGAGTLGPQLTLGSLEAGSSLQAALEAGEFIYHRVFRGDRNRLQQRGRKCQSLRRLAAQPGLQMSVSSLWRAVSIYELSLRFPELACYEHVGVGHVSVVLGLPSAHIFRLLRQTEEQRWTKRRLQLVVSELRQTLRRGNGRSNVVDSLAGVELLSREVQCPQLLAELSRDEAERALEVLERIRADLSRLEARLSHRTTD